SLGRRFMEPLRRRWFVTRIFQQRGRRLDQALKKFGLHAFGVEPDFFPGFVRFPEFSLIEKFYAAQVVFRFGPALGRGRETHAGDSGRTTTAGVSWRITTADPYASTS